MFQNERACKSRSAKCNLPFLWFSLLAQDVLPIFFCNCSQVLYEELLEIAPEYL